MTNLRQLAEGKPCMIRLPGICNHNTETTVLCHFRMNGISGMGLKAPDLLGAWGCSSCHAWVDSHHDDATILAFADGVFRTIAHLVKLEAVRW